MAAALRPGEPLPAPVSAELAGAGQGLGWLRSRASVTGAAGDPAVLRPNDLRLGAGDGADRVPAAARLSTAPAGAGPVGAAVTVLADALAANPYGRRRYEPGLPTGHLRVSDVADRWWIERRPGGSTLVTGRVGDPLDERQAAVLHALRLVTCAQPDAPPGAYAAVLAQLAMTGVPLHAPRWVHPSTDAAATAVLADADADTWARRSARARTEVRHSHDPDAVVRAWADLLHGDVPAARSHFAAFSALGSPNAPVATVLQGRTPG